MKYRYLGNSGLLVSRISLGTMTFGVDNWGCDEETSHALMKRYLELGGNHIDTANIYAGGRSEEIVGSFLPQINRDSVTIATKSYFRTGDNPTDFGSSRRHIISACEASLKRLNTDYIDLYYLHGPDPITPMEETLRALDDLIRQGKVRYIGASNIFAWQLAKAAGICERLHLSNFIAGQYLYNLIHREPEREIIPAAVDSGVGIMTWSPLGGGLLTGKYKNMEEPEAGTRISYRRGKDDRRFWHERGFETAKILEDVARQSDQSIVKLAIGWALKRQAVSSVIIGARTMEQLEVNMEPGEWDVPDDVWQILEQRTRLEDDYLTAFNRDNYEQFFAVAEFYDSRKNLL